MSLIIWGKKCRLNTVSGSRYMSNQELLGNGTLGWYPAIFYKGDNFHDYLFAFLHTKPLLKKGLLLKERICSQGEQILSFKSRPLFRRETKSNLTVPSLESVSIPFKKKANQPKDNREPKISAVCIRLSIKCQNKHRIMVIFPCMQILDFLWQFIYHITATFNMLQGKMSRLQMRYGKYPKISHTTVSYKLVYANSADPDQTAPVCHSTKYFN